MKGIVVIDFHLTDDGGMIVLSLTEKGLTPFGILYSGGKLVTINGLTQKFE